jgi:hypothetical protein
VSNGAGIISTGRQCIGTSNFLSSRLWRRSNNIFVSAPKLLIFIYINPGVLLALRTGLGALS